MAETGSGVVQDVSCTLNGDSDASCTSLSVDPVHRNTVYLPGPTQAPLVPVQVSSKVQRDNKDAGILIPSVSVRLATMEMVGSLPATPTSLRSPLTLRRRLLLQALRAGTEALGARSRARTAGSRCSLSAELWLRLVFSRPWAPYLVLFFD